MVYNNLQLWHVQCALSWLHCASYVACLLPYGRSQGRAHPAPRGRLWSVVLGHISTDSRTNINFKNYKRDQTYFFACSKGRQTKLLP
eukprot:6389483-Amphidinium_carterae.1